MPTPHSPENQHDAARVADEASLWLARRDRGLSAREQDEYLRWLAADARHAEAMRRHAAAFERMMRLYEWQPGQSAEANPDLFAPAKPTFLRPWGWGIAAAAVLVVSAALLWRQPTASGAGEGQKSYVRANERQALPDGSVVELKDGSRILVEFTAAERRVRLSGEAHFQVVKGTAPFVVVAGRVAVRAVGTAFNTRIDADAVEVFVTQGRVAVARIEPAGDVVRPALEGENQATASAGLQWAEVAVGQRSIVQLAPAAQPRVADVSAAEAARLLEWRALRLQFAETPLAVAVGEFNRRNAVRLVLADRDLGAVPIGGTFRADNPQGFAHILGLTLELKVTRRGEHEIVLAR
ncbi:MAG: FecR domain-containing protein [Opitutaceae bacterium]|nr:FecR domain-containing protein [Opitutaceae bacterium]